MSESARPVTVATDGSKSAERVVRWAADEAARRGLPLRIVHVTEIWPYDIALYPVERMNESLAKVGEDILANAEKLALEHRPGLAVTTKLRRPPIIGALRTESEHAFELVLGNRGHGGFASLLLGSTTLHLAGHAACPMVVVRDVPQVRDDVVAGPREMVVGIDVYHDNTQVLDYAFETAAPGDRLRVVHAFRLAENLVAAGDIDDMEQLEQNLYRRLTETVEPWRKRHPAVEAAEEIVRNHPVAALAELSRQADLLVIGAHGHGVAAGVLSGSVSHGVIHHAHCPVALIRPIAARPEQNGTPA